MGDAPKTQVESQLRESVPAPAAVTLPPRSQERYVFIAEHARGGLGRVWRVFDRELGRELALKESLSDDAEALPGVIAGLREKGFEFATVSELLAAVSPAK